MFPWGYCRIPVSRKASVPNRAAGVTLPHPGAPLGATARRVMGHLSKRRSPIRSPMPTWSAGRTRASFCSAQRLSPWREAFIPDRLLFGPVEWLIERVMSASEPPRTTPRVRIDALEAPLAESSELGTGNRRNGCPCSFRGHHNLVPLGCFCDPGGDVDDLTDNVVLSDHCFSDV